MFAFYKNVTIIQYFCITLLLIGTNFALNKEASVSHHHTDNRPAEDAVDGDLSTRAVSSGGFITGDYWWKVDIGERIIFTYATIYVRTGNCENPPIECCK